MSAFHICSLSPCRFGSTVALATARAGHVAFLDAAGDEWPRRGVIAELAARTASSATLGVRLDAGRAADAADVLAPLADRDHWVIVANWRADSLARMLRAIERPRRSVWIEVTALDQVVSAGPAAGACAGWVARGSEVGGLAGRASAFVLAQGLAGQAERKPFLVQGALGLRAAAACRVAGAAGVILDDQLLLTAESPLSEVWRDRLAKMDCRDTIVAGEELGAPRRFVYRADAPAGAALVAAAAQAHGEARPGTVWRQACARLLGWGPPDQWAWPIGEAAGFAARYAERFRTCGRVLGAFASWTTGRDFDAAVAARPLAPGSLLAQSHGTAYPIVQGPMTRVSDQPAFAEAVAGAGALPLLALALLSREDVAALLAETAARLGGRPWGVGILGFVSPAVREGQLAAIRDCRPPFALIAGGRPDQAAELEALGIATYLHVPTPEILRLFLSQGARRFVFEGNECGGHTGPLSSLALWQQAIDVILADVPAAEASRVHAIFAGGIHDAVSAAMVSAMAASLAARGVRVGVLMGTAYLFTEEIVSSGALTQRFQAEAIACRQTVKLATGPGHTIRCAPTPFADEFAATRRRLEQEDLPPAERSSLLDQLTLGRSRVASKGILRDAGGRLTRVGSDDQYRLGMYMMGEVAALRNAPLTIAELHAQASDGSARRLSTFARPFRRSDPAAPVPVAIVGLSCLLPGAQDPATLWRNLLAKRDALAEIPRDRFDWRLYFDPDPKAEDKIYSRWGGFIDELPFDPLRYGIPPRSLKSISIAQLLGLEAASRTLADAGYASGEFDRENTAVIIGMASTADSYYAYVTRSCLPTCAPVVDRSVLDRLPAWTEETFPGQLLNVTAGRIANRLDLGGPNYVVDAACASSLAALQHGVRELETGRSNLALVLGVELDQTPYAFLAFSKTRALSPTGKPKPFDREADGIAISEGVVGVLLKRLADAERDGDRIYAVVRAVEGSSDGKGLSLTAPQPAGQRRALDRAYARAGVSPASVGLYEAHGTGTAVGDRAELETIVATLDAAGCEPRACVIGSAKSLLGHTRTAAGLVGVAKAALALHHRTLPPHAGVARPLEPLESASCPVRLIDDPQPWVAGGPRRAAVSAFGFGGANFHAVLDEYRAGVMPAPLGADAWPAELVVFAADDRPQLVREIDDWLAALTAGRSAPLRDIAWTCAMRASGLTGRARLALVAGDELELRRMLEDARARLLSGGAVTGRGVRYADTGDSGGQLAFLFPGQGSQYPGMCRDLAVYFPEIRAALDAGLAALPSDLATRVRSILLPDAAFGDAAASIAEARAAETDAAQPALAILEAGGVELLRRLGLRPAAVAGHSFGEYAALHAAGAFDRVELLRLAVARGAAMAGAARDTPGTMAAVFVGRERLADLIADFPGLTVANHNAPDQHVVSGPREAVERAVAAWRAHGVRAALLPVGAAFHSPAMRSANEALRRAIERADVRRPGVPVYANGDGRPYPTEPAAIRQVLAGHLERPVEFAAQVEALYDAGVRVFVEVGPKAVLTGLVGRTLGDRAHVAVAVDRDVGRLRGLLSGLATLFAEGVPFDLRALFDGRETKLVHRDASRSPAPEWHVDGGRVRHRDEAVGLSGVAPLLTAETVAGAAQQPHGGAALHLPAGDAALAAYAEYQRTMREFLHTQEQLLERLLGRPGSAGVVSGVVSDVGPDAGPDAGPDVVSGFSRTDPSDVVSGFSRTSEPPPARDPAPDVPVEALPADSRAAIAPTIEGVTSALIERLADRTGFAPDVFDLDHDLEAELGIDSIKRVEIIGQVLDRLDSPARSDRAEMDRFMRARTLRALAQSMVGSLGARARPATCPRFVVRGEARPAGAARSLPAGAGVLVAADALGVAELVVELLRRHGAAPVLLPPDRLLTGDAVARELASIAGGDSPLAGIVHLAALRPSPSVLAFDGWRAEAEIQAKSLFELLKGAAGRLGPEAGCAPMVLAATMFGGDWGRTLDGPREPRRAVAAAGAVHGLLRSFVAERPQVAASVVDLDASEPAARLAEQIVAELLAGCRDAEVGYRAGVRTVFRVERQNAAAPETPRPWKPQPGWVVLATGGAIGITAHAAAELAGPGVRLVIVGRTPLQDDEDTDTSEAGAQRLRGALLDQARREGRKVVPAAIDQQVRGIIRNRHRLRTLRLLRERGADVEYHALDVRSETAFGALIDDVYARLGRIDAVLHGAGIIEDALLERKTRASFDRVFDTKADSTFLLRERLRGRDLKWIVIFGSITARLGNIGQADYAAANEVLNRLGWDMARSWPAAGVCVVNWGPWEGGGMVSDDLRRALMRRGFEMTPPEAAARFLADELALGRAAEVEVIAGSGPWNQSRAEPAEPPAAISEPDAQYTSAEER